MDLQRRLGRRSGAGHLRDPRYRHRADGSPARRRRGPYGSDAIAGVVNFRLKDNREGVSLEAKYGVYEEDSDEDLFSVAANFGLP